MTKLRLHIILAIVCSGLLLLCSCASSSQDIVGEYHNIPRAGIYWGYYLNITPDNRYELFTTTYEHNTVSTGKIEKTGTSYRMIDDFENKNAVDLINCKIEDNHNSDFSSIKLVIEGDSTKKYYWAPIINDKKIDVPDRLYADYVVSGLINGNSSDCPYVGNYYSNASICTIREDINKLKFIIGYSVNGDFTIPVLVESEDINLERSVRIGEQLYVTFRIKELKPCMTDVVIRQKKNKIELIYPLAKDYIETLSK